MTSMMLLSMLWNVGLELPDDDSKWNHIKVEGHVGAPDDLVDASGNLVEASAILEWSW